MKVTILPFVSMSAYNSAHESSDYMLDQIFHGLSSLENVQVQQIPENKFMFKDCDKNELKNIWGKGFTLYGLLEHQSSFPVDESDLIICPLHHTVVRYQREYGEFLDSVVKAFPKSKVIAVDGWDQPDFLPENASICPYFKRELTDDRTDAIPVFFAIPEEKFYPITPSMLESKRKYDFSPMVPANFSWGGIHTSNYIYQTEDEYYEQYRQSYFGMLCKKGGIQTGRTLEVVANNCLPFFTDIESYPKNTMHNWPKELCIEIKKLKGVYPGTLQPYQPEINTFIGDTRQIREGKDRGYINHDEFDIPLYYSYLRDLKSYCKVNFTTKALAIYILEKSL